MEMRWNGRNDHFRPLWIKWFGIMHRMVSQRAMGCTKFTTSGAHDVIAITSPQKNDLCTEELRDRAQVARSLDEISLPLRRAIDSVVYFLGRERGLWG